MSEIRIDRQIYVCKGIYVAGEVVWGRLERGRVAVFLDRGFLIFEVPEMAGG